MIAHLEREIERITRKKKRKKLKRHCIGETSKQLIDERFLEHSCLFIFFTYLKSFCDNFSGICGTLKFS